MTDDELLELAKDAWGRDKLGEGRVDHRPFYVDFGRLVMKATREDCAKMCENVNEDMSWQRNAGNLMAEIIRSKTHAEEFLRERQSSSTE